MKSELEASETRSKVNYQLICNCVTKIEQECLPLLLQRIETMVKLVSEGPIQFVSLINKEIAIIIRSLFFFYSSSPVCLHVRSL